ncbi:MAG: hypothetical protein LRY74_18280 [Shewanella xiamenensis]|nr:hypothetical protein [Shewanella xiamenensis]
MSGDGGWATLDKSRWGGILQQQGWPVVGWSSLKYYWKQKDPKDVTQDTLAIIGQVPGGIWHAKSDFDWLFLRGRSYPLCAK